MNAFIIFSFVASITPGPTNILILSMSSRNGFLKTLPLILGASVAASLIVWLAGAGFGHILLNSPNIRKIMMAAGIFWLTFLAYKLFASPVSNANTPTQYSRHGFLLGAGMQIVNPKTWMMSFAVISVFLPHMDMTSQYGIKYLSLTFAIIAFGCLSLWALLGSQSHRWLKSPTGMRIFNQIMAILLLISAWWSVFN
ncbi:LysE family translocator [Brenneria goodwinii]|uniref:LysE family translocator n=1 Tax=Brenneria goodwinii TaxID=1109412 RepID=UPI000EF1DE3B|nr:LysE family translocator [Brenneria goodwinii]MCG8155411.1 LysE family translocator [Brenneria goodwinii]MCG8161611.1 LysE family translocator [Brenneria goodwinii]MCG8166042.1 LysE family translocator [Brenneria goodwinii]MCG8169258.1 LysE family translocator [Brenneria goodwinii]MCG8175738.1 LysE family translocator [Brenneria goodwinii]